ncbi:hypothetical protein GDO81_017899 [Engystomops pustulosus]|uniref:Uncharacterized protein n=1 Tax=Engystomops pustulosus TaxID=76066 RepID=A0AAV7A3T6_ENGPU|nr:hypothetical protein GDO81_017899 [Engystomops pustulosus]
MPWPDRGAAPCRLLQAFSSSSPAWLCWNLLRYSTLHVIVHAPSISAPGKVPMLHIIVCTGGTGAGCIWLQFGAEEGSVIRMHCRESQGGRLQELYIEALHCKDPA